MALFYIILQEINKKNSSEVPLIITNQKRINFKTKCSYQLLSCLRIIKKDFLESITLNSMYKKLELDK